MSVTVEVEVGEKAHGIRFTAVYEVTIAVTVGDDPKVVDITRTVYQDDHEKQRKKVSEQKIDTLSDISRSAKKEINRELEISLSALPNYR